MANPLSPETESQIDAICETIARRDQLGEDVREELRGHIEDKVIGYLDGEEALSEADALLLAREHFGNPVSVRALLFDSHPSTRWRPWARATIELVTIVLATQAFVRTAHTVSVWFAAYTYEVHALLPVLRWIDNIRDVVQPVLLLFVLLLALRARLRQGKSSVLDHLTSARLAAWFAAVGLLWLILPEVQYQGDLQHTANGVREQLISSAAALVSFSICTVWIAVVAREWTTMRWLILIAITWPLFNLITSSGILPRAVAPVLYDPSHPDWVNLPSNTIHFGYSLYPGIALVYMASSGQVLYLLVIAWGLLAGLVRAAVGLLCYLGLGQLNAPGFRRDANRIDIAQTVA